MKEIFEQDDKWYFWNETWSESHGPFNTREEAVAKLREYCVNVLGYKFTPEEEDEFNRGYN